MLKYFDSRIVSDGYRSACYNSFVFLGSGRVGGTYYSLLITDVLLVRVISLMASENSFFTMAYLLANPYIRSLFKALNCIIAN